MDVMEVDIEGPIVTTREFDTKGEVLEVQGLGGLVAVVRHHGKRKAVLAMNIRLEWDTELIPRDDESSAVALAPCGDSLGEI